MAMYSDQEVDESVVLYTTGCPRCKTLEKRLNDAGVKFVKNTSVDEMLSLGLTNVPVLRAEGWMLDYKAAMDWVEKHEIKHGGVV